MAASSSLERLAFHWTRGGTAVATTRSITFDATADFAFVANFLPTPALTMTHTAAPVQITIAWPAPSTGWMLEESADLVTWTASTRAVSAAAGQKVVTIGAGGPNTFFRLVLP